MAGGARQATPALIVPLPRSLGSSPPPPCSPLLPSSLRWPRRRADSSRDALELRSSSRGPRSRDWPTTSRVTEPRPRSAVGLPPPPRVVLRPQSVAARKEAEWQVPVSVIPEVFPGVEGLKPLGNPGDIVPAILDERLIDERIPVTSIEAYAMCGRLARAGFFVGQSSGAYLAGVEQVARREGRGRVVTLFNDLGERYLSTRLWERSHGSAPVAATERPVCRTPVRSDDTGTCVPFT